MDLNERVLFIPEVLALLGDNPMQSEFACHIGLPGKLFCRACWVKGRDALDSDEYSGDAPAAGQAAAGGNESDRSAISDEGSVGGLEQSDALDSEAQGQAKGKGKVKVRQRRRPSRSGRGRLSRP